MVLKDSEAMEKLLNQALFISGHFDVQKSRSVKRLSVWRNFSKGGWGFLFELG